MRKLSVKVLNLSVSLFTLLGDTKLQREPVCSRAMRIKATTSTCFLLCPKTEDIKELAEFCTFNLPTIFLIFV